MKIYVVCDLEGTAGVCDQAHQCSFIHDQYAQEYVAGSYGVFYPQARKLATLELNALVEGALAGGATEIVAWDGHCRFPGGLDIEVLHPECKLVMNAGDDGPAGLDPSFAAVLLLGAHARGGTPGAVLAHGRFAGMEWNGEELGEIGMICATAGWLGVPVIFISGDRAAVDEARRFVPGIAAAVVKESLHRRTPGIMEPAPLISLAPLKARELIRQTAQHAVERISDIAPPPRPPFNPIAEEAGAAA
jgi:D-amino peptidase